ncbi:MAG TPA: hypothetical protein D7I10_06005 [Candidatus Poseidoniales archaeon]|nr:MAG TPA: hypothetical protein D7I10_06005 [Candidatus Poseidoniales archaeon]HIH81968.1 hypothetical protein [Candidatus Thalassarchaeaceae archaeon]
MDEVDEQGETPTVTDVVKNLLDPSTLPHVILIGVAGFILYMISSSGSDSLFALGIAGFIGLSVGYALTAWMQEMNVIHKFSHFQPLPEKTSLLEKILLYFIRIFSAWISPLMLGLIPFTLISLYLTSDSGKDQAVYWGIAIAGMFVVWSFAQGRALSTSLRIFVQGRAVKIASIERNSKRFTSTSIHMTIIGVFAAVTYWILVSGANSTEDMSFIDMLGAILFALVAVAIQALLFWRTTDGRIADSRRKDTAAFGFAWGLFMQLFVTWHLLSALRRFMFEDWGLFLILEEFILMIITVIAAIWSLAKGAHQRGFKMFNEKNAVFWGLSFGMAYSGSIAMISVLGSKLTEGAIGTLGVSTTIGIGHLITAFTMLMIHSWRIGSLEQWLDSAREEYSVIEVDGEPDESQVDETEETEDTPEEQDLDMDIELVEIPDPVLEDDGFVE